MKESIHVCAIFLYCFVSTSFAATPSFQGLGNLSVGYEFGEAWDISADGATVVGWSWLNSTDREAFRWTEEDGMVGLGDLAGGDFLCYASDVSADGSVVVGRSSSKLSTASYPYEAFRWENGAMVGLGDLAGGGFYSYANNVSADGSVIVGSSSTSTTGSEAFRWTEEGGNGWFRPS